jgi:hypothetical protein
MGGKNGNDYTHTHTGVYIYIYIYIHIYVQWIFLSFIKLIIKVTSITENE